MPFYISLLLVLCECANPSSLNGQVVKDLFLIEKILIEAQEKILQKRIEMSLYIKENEELILSKIPNQVFLPMPATMINQFPQPLQEPQNKKQKRPTELIDLESEEEPRKQNNFDIEVNFSNSDKKQKKIKKSIKTDRQGQPFMCHKCEKCLSSKDSLINHLAVKHGLTFSQNQKSEIAEKGKMKQQKKT